MIPAVTDHEFNRERSVSLRIVARSLYFSLGLRQTTVYICLLRQGGCLGGHSLGGLDVPDLLNESLIT